ncbi:HU family DNA-binding protein [Fusobacterium sp. SB021]
MKKALSENEKITFKKFGIFEVKETKERDICDPRRINKKIMQSRESI